MSAPAGRSLEVRHYKIESADANAPPEVKQLCGIYRKQRKPQKIRGTKQPEYGPTFLNKRTQLHLFQIAGPDGGKQWVVAARLNSVAYRARQQPSATPVGSVTSWKITPTRRASEGGAAVRQDVQLQLQEAEHGAIDPTGPAESVVLHSRFSEKVAGLYERSGADEPPTYHNEKDGMHLFLLESAGETRWYVSTQAGPLGATAYEERSDVIPDGDEGRAERSSPEEADWHAVTLVRVTKEGKLRLAADESDDAQFRDSEFPKAPQKLADCLGSVEQRKRLGWADVAPAQWRRAPALVPPTEDVRLFACIEPSDMLKGALGDTWLLSAIGCLAEFPEFVQKQLFKSASVSDKGQYTLQLYDAAAKQWHDVEVDDRIPCDKCDWYDMPRPLFSKAIEPELYMVLVEKAFAKFAGSYANLAGGSHLRAWVAATGCNQSQLEVWSNQQAGAGGRWALHGVDLSAENVPRHSWAREQTTVTDTVNTEEALFKRLREYDQANYVMAASIEPREGEAEKKLENGLVKGHAYSLLQVRLLDLDDSQPKQIKPLQLLQLRNPWGNDVEWNGDWSDDSKRWDELSAAKRAELGFEKRDDGLFWMGWDDFRRKFGLIEVCKVAMPGQRANFHGAEVAAGNALLEEDIDEAIDAETKTHAELDDDPIDSVEHRAIVGRARRLIAEGGLSINDAVHKALIDEVLPEKALPAVEPAPGSVPPAEAGPTAAELAAAEAEEAERRSTGEPQAAVDEEAERAAYEAEQLGGVDNEAGATVALGGAREWKGSLNADFDSHMAATMREAWALGKANYPQARNVGQQYAETHASPLAPNNGFYDQRYVCATLPMAEIDEENDFAFLLGNEDEDEPPPERVTLAMKGLTDLHVQWIASFLDEQGENGQAIRLNKEQNEGVRKLYLGDNNITHEGIQHLAAALRNNGTLEELYLQYTAIGDAGLQHLLEMLPHNQTLRRLECGCCGITSQGAQEVVKVLRRKENSTLEILGLFGNDDEIDDDLPEIYALLAENSGGGKK